jgi:protein PhnA
MTQKECELCASQNNLSAYDVPHSETTTNSTTTVLCATCQEQCENMATLDENHWHCLNTSIWSENPAVKVLAWRLLNKLLMKSWAQDLLDQLYLEDDILEWAKAGVSVDTTEGDHSPETRDSNGTALAEGDAVTLIKDLEVKGANFTAKRGTLVKGITLTGDPTLIEGRVNGTLIVLKTCFLKKAN